MLRERTTERLTELRAMSYESYLQTPEWRHRRDRALARALWQCEWPKCPTRYGLQVHHKSYDHLGDELDQELAVVCRDHHEQVHHVARGSRLWLVVVRDAIKRGRYASIADFLDELKTIVAAEYHVTVDPFQLNAAVNLLTNELRLMPDVPLPREVLPEIAGPPDQQEACQILANIRATHKARIDIKPMPRVTPLKQRTVDRVHALQIVSTEIIESIARCEAFERASGL